MFHILVIDDDSATQAILRRTLERQGYQVSVASNGVEGVALARQINPSLIICDWMMPTIDGLEVCRQIKSDAELSTTFFVLLTSRTGVEDRIIGLDTGADDFLSKPVEMSELKARVRAGLRIHQLTQDLHQKNQTLEVLAQDLQGQKQTLEAEFNEASEYVRSLLPPPLTTGSAIIDSRFIPSRRLGGDCFDFYWLDPDYLVMYLLDVSGHGLGAALPSVSILNLLRSQSLPGVNFYQPNHVLSALNETFQMNEQNERYFTIWYGVYNQVNRQLIYSSAGHPPALLLSGSQPNEIEVKQLKTPALPIGMLPEAKFSNAYCKVEPESRMYIFSDGVYEIGNPAGEMWGLKDFIELLQTNRQQGKSGLDQILNQIQTLHHIETFDDDLSLLQIDFT